MSHYEYLVIGEGLTADTAVRAIGSIDRNGAVGLIGADLVPPVDRPPLSNGLWNGKTLDSFWKKTENLDVELNLGRRIRSLDPKAGRATDDEGQVYTFDNLLLATGGTPQYLPFGTEQIIYFRTLQTYERLRATAEKGHRFAVIGDGFISSEIAAALMMNGNQVVMIFPGEAIGEHMFPRDLALFLNDFYRQKGVKVWANESVTGLKTHSASFTIETESQRRAKVDGVVAGIGTQPNVELAELARSEMKQGMVVNGSLVTGHSGNYAADAAAYYDPASGMRRSVEPEGKTHRLGELAGHNLPCGSAPNRPLPFFYSNLFELGYEAVGEVDARLETVSDWKDPYGEGVIYYLKDQRVQGVLLWNVENQVEAARELIAEPGPFCPNDLKGRLPLSA